MSVPASIQNLVDTYEGAVSKLKAAMTDTTAAGYNPNWSGEGGSPDNNGYISSLIQVRDSTAEELYSLGYDVAGNQIGNESITEGYT